MKNDKMKELIEQVEKEPLQFTHSAEEIRAINQNQDVCVPKKQTPLRL